MRRLYFTLPDITTANTVVDELLLKRVDDHHIHVVAREGTPMGDLPEASLLQKSDFIPAVERGLAVGGITGILAGIAAVTFPPPAWCWAAVRSWVPVLPVPVWVPGSPA